MHDLVISGGLVVDGSGGEPFQADVAVNDGIITEVGRVTDGGRERIDASGQIVTPGFIDIHTHYDAQVTWDDVMAPSIWHGATTVVLGNCGVGFAPVAPGKQEWLVELMEGVESIPGAALLEGIHWQWETFPQYVDALESLPRTLDVGTQLPHGPLRAYVMGERGAKNERATDDDIVRMAQAVTEAIEAGALGFSTSRFLGHRALDGECVPGTYADERELFGLCRPLGALGRGVVEVAPAGMMGDDPEVPAREADWMHRVALETQRPVSFLLGQHPSDSEEWRERFREAERSAAAGASVHPQVASRSVSHLVGLQTGLHPFSALPGFAELLGLPLAEQVRRMREPSLRARLVAEYSSHRSAEPKSSDLGRLFPIGDPPNYEPSPEDSIAGIAARERRDPVEVLYDTFLLDEGREMVMSLLVNFVDFNLDAVGEMLNHPLSRFGLSDAGAHADYICDVSTTTFMLAHWARDRTRGTLPLERIVHKMTAEPAGLYGLGDRGLVRVGLKADINVIDFDGLSFDRPTLVHDLPAGAPRLLQRATGYTSTIVSGEVVCRDSEVTERRPGRVVRGASGTRP